MKLIMFCEADADFRTASLLIDEMLCLRVDWVRDQFPEYAESVRAWHPDTSMGRSWFDLHKVYDIAVGLDVIRHHGHFNGEPGEPGALMLDTAARIVRKIRRQRPEQPIDALILVWDMDTQGTSRKKGLAQAMKTNTSGVKIILACPDPIRETWVLAGFTPTTKEEKTALDTEHQALGFWPNEEPHRLIAENDQAKLHAKRVLKEALGVDSWEREEGCLKIPDEERRSLLSKRGAGCGLEDFLAAIERELIPLVGG